jgi:sugar phosphate permease
MDAGSPKLASRKLPEWIAPAVDGRARVRTTRGSMAETVEGTQTNVAVRLKRLQSMFLTMLCITGVINYIDRSTLAVANPLIKGELDLSPVQMGVLLSAFSWSYALAQLPVGAMIDRAGPRLLLGTGMALWSVAQACGGFVTNLWQFIWARAALGLGEAPQFPAGARVICDWYPPRDRGLPIGAFNASSSVGPALAPPLLTALMSVFGWRGMFVVMGVVGLFVAAAWYALYRDPVDAGLSDEELRSIRDDKDPAPGSVSLRQWGRLFRHRTTWGMAIGFAGALYLIWLYLTWLPGYLVTERHLTVKGTGLVASVPFIFGFFGSLLGGLLSDRLVARGFSPILSRKIPLIAGLLGMAVFTVPAALTASTTVAVLCIALAVFCGNMATANAWALATSVAPPAYVASLGAIQNFGGYFGGSFAPVVTGLIVSRTASFAPALIAGAACAAGSAVVYLVLVRSPIPAESLEG